MFKIVVILTANALILAAFGIWLGSTITRANTTVKNQDDFPSRYSTGGGLSTMPIVY